MKCALHNRSFLPVLESFASPEAVAHCLRSFREMPPRSLVPWWSIIASRARRQEVPKGCPGAWVGFARGRCFWDDVIDVGTKGNLCVFSSLGWLTPHMPRGDLLACEHRSACGACFAARAWRVPPQATRTHRHQGRATAHGLSTQLPFVSNPFVISRFHLLVAPSHLKT